MHSVPLTPGIVYSANPLLLVDDVAATVAYYREALGFGVRTENGESEGSVVVERGEAAIHLMQGPPGCARPNHLLLANAVDVDLTVENAAHLFIELRARGARVVQEPTPQPGGRREFVIEDSNGYRLRFGQDRSEK